MSKTHPLSAALRVYAQPEYGLPAGAAANLEAAAEALDASVRHCEPARPITSLPDLGHDWKPHDDIGGTIRSDTLVYCRRCLISSPFPFDATCPNAVLDYANRLVAEERARAVAVLEGVLRQVRSKEAAATADYDRTAFQYERDEHASGKACAYSEADDLLTEALTTLTGSDR